MSTTEPAPLSLESLQSQIILLQQQLATALADNLSPNYLTINDNGEVSADFSGVITAEGLTIPAYIGATEPEIPNQAQWIDPEGNQVGWIAGQQDASEAGINYLRLASVGTPEAATSGVTIGSQDNAGNTQALLSTNYEPGTSWVEAQAGENAVSIIDSNANSSFLQIGRITLFFTSGISMGPGGSVGPVTYGCPSTWALTTNPVNFFATMLALGPYASFLQFGAGNNNYVAGDSIEGYYTNLGTETITDVSAVFAVVYLGTVN